MRLRSLQIDDFLSHSHTKINLEGIQSALILGCRDGKFSVSNGIGKSNIFYAVRYCLTGDLPPDTTMENIVRDDQQIARVEVEFQQNDEIYRLIRSRNNKTNKSELQLDLWDGKEWKGLTGKTNSETEVEYRKICQIDSKIFDNIVYLPQKSFAKLLTETPAKRKDLFKELLKISIYGKYEKLAQKKQSTVAKELDRLKTLREAKGAPKEAIVTARASLQSQQAQLSLLEEAISSLERQKTSVTLDISALEQQALQSVQMIQQRKAVEERIDTLEQQILATNESIDRLLGEEKTLEEKKRKIEEKILSIGGRIDLLKEEASSFPSEKDLLEEGEKHQTNRANGRILIARTEAEIKDLSRPLTEEDVCRECLQTVPHTHRENVKRERLEALIKAKESLIAHKAKMTRLEGKIEANLQSLQRIKATANNISNLKEEISSLRLQIQSAESSISLNRETQSSRREKKNQLNEEKIQQMNLLDSTPQSKDDTLSKMTPLKEKVRSLDSMIANEKKNLHSTTLTLGQLQARIESAERDIEELKDLALQIEAKELENRIRIREVEAWDPKGIPTMIINNVLDDIQIEANVCLSKIRPELEMSWQVSKLKDEKMDDTLMINFRWQGRDRVVGQLSVGQKMSASLALMVACKKVVAQRLGISVDLICLDEGDADLDEVSLDQYADAIKTLQEEYMVLVITHNQRLKEKFSTAILVENNGEGSIGRLSSI